MSKPQIMFYHDGRHPLIYMYEPPMQKEEYEAGVDELAGTPVEALMFCMGDGRTVLHDTKIGELWGHNVDKWSHLIFRRAHQNAVALIRGGHDPLRVICDRAHEKGLLLYPALLVQQGSGVRGDDVRGSDFRFDNKHLEIGAKGDLDPDHPGRDLLDFKHEEVREDRFAIVHETLNNYEVDGFELQLNYGTHYFHPDEVDAGRELMTAWVGRIYEAVKASGQERELAIRIPASLDACMGYGMDVREWIRKGIVDVLIGQTLGGPELLSQMFNFGPLIAATRGTNCRFHAALQCDVDSDRLGGAPIEMIRAAACNYWAQGIDGLYLAHWFGSWPYNASFYEKLRELPHPDIMDAKDKFYYVNTESGRYGVPKADETGQKSSLPATLNVGKPTKVPFMINDDLRRWHKAGRVHEVLLRLFITSTTERDRFEFRLNGKDIPDDLLRKLNQMYRMTAPRYRTESGYWFIFRLDRAHWPRKGKNSVEVNLVRRDSKAIPDVTIRDVELEIKYLMGKNFHRGQDSDLGPFEHSGI